MDARQRLCAQGLVDVTEATRLLGLGKTTIYGLMEQGRLPYVRFGRARRIPKQALIRLAAENLVVRASYPLEGEEVT